MKKTNLLVSPFWQALFLTLLLVGLFPAFGNGEVQAANLPLTSGGGNKPKPFFTPFKVENINLVLNVPATAAIGSDFTFSVSFENNDPEGDPGYGPFIEIELPAIGADGDDGLTFISAALASLPGSIPPSDIYLIPFTTATVKHPLVRDINGDYIDVTGTPGNQLLVIRLPFGSFTVGQPAVTVDVSVHMSNLADLGFPLIVKARGGYEFGSDPLDNWCCGDLAYLSPYWDSSPSNVTPTLMDLTKVYLGPNNITAETATGPNSIRSYIITANIADGQPLDNFVMSDTLPSNLQLVDITSAGSCSDPATFTIPGGTVTCSFGTVTGGVVPPPSMTLDFYIPFLNDASLPVILPSDGLAVYSDDTADASGYWLPIDSRDQDPLPPHTIHVAATPVTHTLTDRSLAIQKEFSVQGGGILAPQKILKYTLDFQASDFFAFDQIIVTDTISDGQHVIPYDPVVTTYNPTLAVNGNDYTLAEAPFNLARFDFACDYSPAAGPECTTDNSGLPNSGTTTLTFNVSGEIQTRGESGLMVGACVNPAGSPSDPDCSLYDTHQAVTGQITFYTIVQDNFSDDYPSTDPSVDQGDRLDNSALINGNLLDTHDLTTSQGTVSDDAIASDSIPYGNLTKEIFAINGKDCPDAVVCPAGSPYLIKPGDTVTYRLTYTLPTSDEEDLSFTDYLPLPIYDATEITIFDDAGKSGDPEVIPAAGHANFGPLDTFRDYSGIVPTLTPPPDSTSNSVSFTYGSFNNALHLATTVDILFTVTVSAEPFADRLYLTNQANAFEGSTNAGTNTANSIVQVILTEPVLVTRKSSVWAGAWDGASWVTQPNAVFTPALPVTFSDPTNAPRWSGIVTAATDLDSNVNHVDAGDIVTFAMTIQNTGSSLKGAFDIILQDILASNFQIPASGLNLQAYYGDGTGPITYVGQGVACIPGPGDPCGPDGIPGNADDLFGAGIQLDDPLGGGVGVCQAHDPSLHNDIIVITYDLQLKDTVTPGDTANTATITHYAGDEGGPNHVDTPSPLHDDSTTSENTSITKQLTGTEIDNSGTTNTNDATHAVIGELASYKLVVTIPEGTVPTATIVDTLPFGLSFVNLTSVVVSNPTAVTSTVMTFDAGTGNCTNCTAGIVPGTSNPLITNSGRTVTFDLGTLTNTDRDNLIPETITLEYEVLVLNISSNQPGTLLHNSALYSWASSSQTVSAQDITVIGPTVNIDKTIVPSSGDSGDSFTYTITITGATGADAYDVTLEDTIPALMENMVMTGVSDSLGAVTGANFNFNPLTNSLTTVTPWDMPVSVTRTITLTFTGTVSYSASPSQQIDNRSYVHWTSLPGSPGQRSIYNSDSTERTGTGGPVNTYTASDLARFTVNNSSPQKYVMLTSEGSTADATNPWYVTVGEVVRFRLVASVPEGSSPNFMIRDNLPAGMTFLGDGTSSGDADGTAQVVFVTDETGITSTSTGTLPVTAIAGCNTGGTLADDTTPASGTLCLLDDTNIGSDNSTSTDPDTYGSGTAVWFKLGDLINNDSDSDAEFVVVEFNALANNIAGNDAGVDLSNTFDVYIGSPEVNIGHSNPGVVRIAEASITDLAKTATPDNGDAGDTITYQLTFSNANSVDSTTAFDVHIVDIVPGKMTALLGVGGSNITVSSTDGSGSCASGIDRSASSGNKIDIILNEVPAGCAVTITFTATVNESVNPSESINNLAELAYTSLPGANGTTSNGTGSSTPGGSGTSTGERDGSKTAPNDYFDQDDADYTIHNPTFSKSIDSTSASHTSGSNLTIGELVTFGLKISLPEGTIPTLHLVDDLPLGLQYATGSYQVITQTNPPAACGSLTENFASSVPAPTFSATTYTPGGGGTADRLIFDFSSITNPGDNNTSNDTFLVCFQALLLNVIDNQASPISRVNNATLTYNSTNYSGNASVSIVEPVLRIAKTISDSHPAPGEDVVFRVVVDHDPSSTADAFDVAVTDTLPAGLILTSVSTSFSGGLSGVINASDIPTNHVLINIGTFPNGGSLTITYHATVSAGFGTTINNIANVTWTSIPGADTNERTGAGGVDDYSTSSGASLSSDRDLSKSLTGDNFAGTVNPDVTIGEILSFRLVLTIPPASSDTYMLVDTLPGGLAFVDCSDITAGPDVASTAISLHAAGNCNPGVLPGVNNPLITNSGGTISFDFESISNANPAAPETITILYRATVLDITSNLRNVTLENSAQLTWSVGTITRQVPTPLRILEPELNLEKSVSPDSTFPGGIVAYRVHIFHTANSQIDGFDVIVNDVLPLGMTYVTASLQFIAGSGVTPTNLDDSLVDPVTGRLMLRATWDTFPLGQESTIQFRAMLSTFASPGATITNTASVEWTSLPGPVPLPPPNYLSTFNQVNSHERRYDPMHPADIYQGLASVLFEVARMPNTGFAPGRFTLLPKQPESLQYSNQGNLSLEIPVLGLKTSIVGVPLIQSGWDLTWLWSQAGYLEGTAYPGLSGNTVLTAHVYLPNGLTGPFLSLGILRWGDQIILHANGQRYIYEVRTVQQVASNDFSMFKHETRSWLTLITCKGYSNRINGYLYRTVVRASLLRTEGEP
jgi:LPXTG-site transpeptidase (sortase) family protein